ARWPTPHRAERFARVGTITRSSRPQRRCWGGLRRVGGATVQDQADDACRQVQPVVEERYASVASTAAPPLTPISASVPVRPASTTPSPPGVSGICPRTDTAEWATSTSATFGRAPT